MSQRHRHMKRFATPPSWIISRERPVWIAKPMAGPHPQSRCLPLVEVLRSLGVVRTTLETKRLLNTSPVLVDGRRVKEVNFPVGLTDVLSLKEIDQHYRIGMDSAGRLRFQPIKELAATKPNKIVGKKKAPKGKTQLNLFDGRTMLVEKDGFTVGDGIVIDVPSQKIKEHIKLAKGCTVLIIGGRHVGKKATVDAAEGKMVKFTLENGQKAETLQEYTLAMPASLLAQMQVKA